MKIEVHITNGKGQPKVFQLRETAKAVEKKNGGKTLSVWQPEDSCKVLKPFGKLYYDTEAKS